MSFEEYLKTYGTEYIEAVAYKFYKYYFCNNKICDYEDFVQICLMKLFEQWKAWDSNKCRANTFIFMKIKGYGYTLVRDGNAQKRSGLTNEFSLDYEIDNGANKNTKLYDIETNSSCELYNENEKFENLVNYCCSQIENEKHRKIFNMYLHGYSYEEIGKEVNMTTVTTNSTCQRIRRKFKNGIYEVI